MQIDSSRGTFEDVLAKGSPAMIPIAKALRQLIVDLHPQITEIPRPAENHADYGVGTHASEVFGYICPMQRYVRLGFYYGGSLPDPEGVLAGEGKRLRHIKIYTVEDTQNPAIRRLLQSAIEEMLKTHR